MNLPPLSRRMLRFLTPFAVLLFVGPTLADYFFPHPALAEDPSLSRYPIRICLGFQKAEQDTRKYALVSFRPPAVALVRVSSAPPQRQPMNASDLLAPVVLVLFITLFGVIWIAGDRRVYRAASGG